MMIVVGHNSTVATEDKSFRLSKGTGKFICIQGICLLCDPAEPLSGISILLSNGASSAKDF